METKQSMSNSQGMREFYLPAMSVLSSVPGRLERFFSTHLSDHSHLVFGETTKHPARAFYLPAMGVLSNVPTRVERFLSVRLGTHDTRSGIGALRGELRDFYLPGTFRIASRRR